MISAGASHQTITLTREAFQEFTSDLLERTQARLENVIEEAGLNWPDISKVDLRYVKTIGSGDIRFDNAKPAGYPLLMRVAYDVDGLIHAYVFDGNTNAPFGELHIKRESNLTPDELAAMKQRLSALTLG